MSCFGTNRRCGTRHGSIYKVHFQHLHFDDVRDGGIEVPLSVSKKVMGMSLARKRGWVTWYSWDREMLCATALSQWDAESRSEWLGQLATTPTPRASSQSSPSPRNVILFFVLLHGMSPPGADFDVIENWSNVIKAILETLSSEGETDFLGSNHLVEQDSAVLEEIRKAGSFGKECMASHSSSDLGRRSDTPGAVKPKLQACFWAPTYRRQTMMSIEACLEVIIPALVRELEDYVSHFDDIRIYSVGHSLGGLLSRFIFNRRLGDLFAAQKEKKSCPYTFLRGDLSARLASVIGNERVHLQTLCTLASPHAGSLGTNALLRFLPEIVSKFRFLLASQMAQQICNLDESNLLERLCIYEAAGDSWIWPEIIENIQDLLNLSSSLEDLNSVCSLEPSTPAPIDGSAKVSSLHDRQAPASENCEAAIVSYEEYGKGRKSFQKVVLYGILNTDWLVSANSALGTQLDVTKTHAAEHALIEEMTPISLDPATEFDCGILPDLLTKEAGEAIRKAGRELEILETLPKVKRFLVHIPQNPIMTKPHSTIKGAPSRVTPEKEKSMRLTARRILRHVGRSVVGR